MMLALLLLATVGTTPLELELIGNTEPASSRTAFSVLKREGISYMAVSPGGYVFVVSRRSAEARELCSHLSGFELTKREDITRFKMGGAGAR